MRNFSQKIFENRIAWTYDAYIEGKFLIRKEIECIFLIVYPLIYWIVDLEYLEGNGTQLDINVSSKLGIRIAINAKTWVPHIYCNIYTYTILIVYTKY